jgi:hypothetical protein
VKGTCSMHLRGERSCKNLLEKSEGRVSLGRLRSKRGCIQKFPDWPPGAETENGKALCH